ncbi:MAG: F0F1 ATP synthase subunit A [Fimbriimonas sp.]|nr:F0F1 ATP synthase subunit A [Fimbriimonas sp.]
MHALLQLGQTLFAAANSGPVEGASFLGLAVYFGLLLAILAGLMAYAKRGFGVQVFKNPITVLFEHLYLFIENMCVGSIGPNGRKYIPYIMTLWMVIFLSNVMALFFPEAPTADLNFNLGLAVMTILYVQIEGIRTNGFFGHLKHFAGPKLGIWMIPISGMIFCIEIISELMKNLSLSLRLYGNIHGGHMAVESMNALGTSIYIPIGAFLMPLKVLTCVVQALIFTLLTCVYLSLVTHHDVEDHAEAASSVAHAH